MRSVFCTKEGLLKEASMMTLLARMVITGNFMICNILFKSSGSFYELPEDYITITESV
jgi:hypothetical protein